MIFVDSSVWIDFLAGRPTPQTDFLKDCLGKRRIVTGDLVVAEVLQGTRSDADFEKARALLTMLRPIAVADPELAVAAAGNYRALRNLGITVRRTIDVLIATRCIEEHFLLLHRDRDFDPFKAHLGLRFALDYFGVY